MWEKLHVKNVGDLAVCGLELHRGRVPSGHCVPVALIVAVHGRGHNVQHILLGIGIGRRKINLAMQMGNVVKGHCFVKARGVPRKQHLVTEGLLLGNKKLVQIKVNISATEPHHGLGVVHPKPNKNNAQVNRHGHKGHHHG